MRSSKTNRTKQALASPRANEKGFSLIELLIVVAIILIIAAIAIPNMLASKKAANQAAAVSAMRTITSGSFSYSVIYGNGYPPTFDTLGGNPGIAANCQAAILVDQTIASAPYQKSGYQFTYAPENGNITNMPASCTSPGANGYLLTAAPVAIGETGNISYCSTEDGVIHYDPNASTPGSEAACQAFPNVQ
jgi:prepilin-type N-terminal cleavage/methylation domain-containing protein